MKTQKILIPIIAVLGALVFFSVFIIKEVNQAIVLQFGDPKRIIVASLDLATLSFPTEM